MVIGVINMENKELKIKLWAIQGILNQVNGIEVSEEDALKVSSISLKVYEDIVNGENVFENATNDANKLLKELIDDVLGRKELH